MKPREYDFTINLLKGPVRTRREIIDSLKQFARESKISSFTQKQYDKWPGRVLCSHQVAERFGSWADAMQEAGFIPQWGVKKDLNEMVELFMDCWEEHNDAPTVRVLDEFLQRKGLQYTAHMYARYFGGVRHLAKRVADFHLGKISEAQLVERFKRVRSPRRQILPALRKYILERDRNRCVRCRSKGPLDVHHKVPVAQGGTDDPANLETLCEPCHVGEHAARLFKPKSRPGKGYLNGQPMP